MKILNICHNTWNIDLHVVELIRKIILSNIQNCKLEMYKSKQRKFWWNMKQNFSFLNTEKRQDETM